MEQPILLAKADRVAWIKINRPKKLNALNAAVLEALHSTFESLEQDDEVRVVVLTGNGEKAFVAGADISEFASFSKAEAYNLVAEGQKNVFDRIAQFPKPVIAAINGPAAGYGLDLALGADIRLMSDAAMLMPGFARMGVVPESGGTWYLPRLLGWAKACEVSMLGDNLNGEAAEDYGLVNKVVPADEFEATVTAWAEKIAANAPLAIQEMKRLFRHGLTQDFESHSHHVLMSVMNLFKSEDFKEGVTAFATRRAPEFKGR